MVFKLRRVLIYCTGPPKHVSWYVDNVSVVVPSYGLIARITGIMLHSGRKKNTDILTDRGPPIRNRAGCVPNYCQPKGYKLLGKYASCDEVSRSTIYNRLQILIAYGLVIRTVSLC